MNATEQFFGKPISTYTTEDAISDGIKTEIGSNNGVKIYITGTLLFDGYEDEEKLKALVNLGLAALNKPDDEDTTYMKLRVLKEQNVWVIYNAEGVTLMRPEDY